MSEEQDFMDLCGSTPKITDRQRQFAIALCKKVGVRIPYDLYSWDRARASEFISKLKAEVDQIRSYNDCFKGTDGYEPYDGENTDDIPF